MSEQRTLGKTGICFPPIIYGTSFLGNLYRELTEDEKMAIMKAWFHESEGPVMIDSAGKYGAGLALEVIGAGLEKLGVHPEKVIISNKLGWYRVPLEGSEPSFERGVWANLRFDAVQKISYKGILKCWKQGNDLLGNRYKSEVVSVHDPDEYLAGASNEQEREERLEDIVEAYQALFELKNKGLVRAVGIGAKDWAVIRELYHRIGFDWVMFANSFTIYDHPAELLRFMDELEQDGVCVINSAVFNAGFLTGGAYFNYRKLNPELQEDRQLFGWRDNFFRICSKHNVKPGDACLKFGISPHAVKAVALNPSKPERIADNRKVLENTLPTDFWEELKKKEIISRNYPYL